MRGDLGGAERVQGVDERSAPKTAEDIQQRHSAKGQHAQRVALSGVLPSQHARRNTHARTRTHASTHTRAHKHAVAASAPISYLSVRKSRRRRPSQHDRAMAEQRTRTDLGSAGACADARQAGGNRTHQASSAAQGQTRANVMRSNATHETRIHNRRAPVQGRQCQWRVYASSQ
jgi:hypothetical protein